MPAPDGRSGPALAALAGARERAAGRQASARRRIDGVLARAGVSADPGRLLGAMASAPVAIHFHPDRIAVDGRSVAESLLADGVYRNQFVTGISNGGLTAFPGGDRDRWEGQLFAGAYQQAGVTPQDRPVYGGLDLLGSPDGPCPRFGSCHLRLGPAVTARATFAFGDSHTDPTDTGTVDVLEPVLAALLETAETTGATLGRPGMSVAALVTSMDGPRPSATDPGRAMDDYIEAQVHGPIRLGQDVDALVADPSFRVTPVGELLAALAERYGLDLRWHPGFALAAEAVPPDVRGPAVAALAERIANQFLPADGQPVLHRSAGRRLDAETLGRAARSVVLEPERWADHGTLDETLQHIKQLWHVLVICGEPYEGV